MIAGSTVIVIDVILRYTAASSNGSTPVYLFIITIAAALIVSLGATLGGTMVFDYGFNVETAGDSPVWYDNEDDVFPGQKAVDPAETSTAP